MNAPATLTAMRPDPAAGAAPSLLAWDLIRRLVAFDTTSRESNLALIDWTRGYLESHGAAIPAIICGPVHIAQAHQPNEWVAVDQLARCEAFMRKLADRVCTA